MRESSCEELTDVTGGKAETNIVPGYPFAFVLRMRVLQIVCGILTSIMGAVALIDEKNHFNLGIGIPAGFSIVLAASNSVYYSKGFNGYQPSSPGKTKRWSSKTRFLGSTLKSVTFNIISWGIATVLIFSLIFNCVKTVVFGSTSNTITILIGIEFSLSLIVVSIMITILWIDLHNNPDWQEPSDIVHSNTGTGVSMVTLSHSIIT